MTDNNKLANERGQRVKALRMALGLSRQEFSDKFSISKGTMQNWEEGRYSGLNEKGAEKIVFTLSSKANVQTSIEWLMFGAGHPPVLPNLIINQSTLEVRPEFLSEESIIRQELLLFHKLNKDCIDTIVPDDLMNPIFYKGDHVAGKRYFEFEIGKLLNHACIIQSKAGEILVRIIASSHNNNQNFDLLAYDNNKLQITHNKIEIFSAAPIIWIRKKIPI